MASQTKTTLKGYFETGDVPTESNFADLIDTIGSSTLVVAANNASNASKGRSDYVCNGTNDEVEIEAAFAALPAGGGRVLLTEGTFTLGATLDIAGNKSRLSGMGNSTLITIANSLSLSAIISAVSIDDLCIDNLKIDGNAANQSGGTSEGIFINSVDGFVIRDVEITNTISHSIDTQTSLNGIITGCILSEFDYDDDSHDGISIGDDESNIAISDCIISHSANGTAARSGIEIEDGAHDITINGCVIHGMQTGVELHVHAGEPAIYNVLVQACTIYDCVSGIAVKGRDGAYTYGITLSGNIVYSNTNGYNLNRCRAVMNGNVAHSNTSSGIVMLSCDYCVISSSWLFDNLIGISINQSDYNIIDGCVIYENTQRGIDIQGATTGSLRNIVSNCTIIDNDADDSGTYDGIFLSAASDSNFFQGNYFYVTTSNEDQIYGIGITAGATGNVIVDNHMEQAGKTGIINDSGTGTVIKRNVGYVTENEGAAASVADGGTIAHGCATTPTVAVVSGSVAGEIVSVTGIDATNITVAIKDNDGSAGTSQTIYWRAYV